MNRFLKADRVIRNLVEGGIKEFVLFPFGEQGMIVKRILNERYGIEEKYIIDNRLSKISDNPKIISLEDIDSYDMDNITVLLTSDNEDIYSEIRYQLLLYFNMKQIVDIFSFSMYFDKQVYFDEFHYGGGVESPRFNALEASAREIYHNKVDGAVAECGVWRGDFAKRMSRLFPDRKLYLFDTFNGFDSRDIDEMEEEMSKDFRKKVKLDDTSVELVLSNMAYRNNVVIRKGYFPETAIGLEEEKFAFVSLDTDLYKPIMAGLDFFYPRLAGGGRDFC
ncbi:MAG: TylF/MycF family methyltransferase [Ruminococcus flavefaciens]|nr:TylF/MycF family methyltransferase [Ruminococcus flavefaciens]